MLKNLSEAKLRLELENLVLLLDRPQPNTKMALEIAKELLEKAGGIYRK